MWDDQTRPFARSDLQYRELADGGVIYDTAAERIHTLNLTAAYIWNCCDGAHTVAEIASELQGAQTALTPERARQDVTDALAHFEREGLLGSP
jgi:hypothetical protein